MSYGISKRDNEYARLVHHIEAPKTVWMAIAVALAARIVEQPDTFEGVPAFILEEWKILHANGLVPQKPRVFKRRTGR